MTRLDDQGEPLEAAHPTPCQDRLRREIARILHDLPKRSWGTAETWLSMRGRVRRMDLGATPLGQRMEEIVGAARERLLRSGATELQLEELLQLYPLVDQAQGEETMDRRMVVKHGCQHCRHFYTSWERRAEREHADSRQKPCTIYGVIPPVCLDHETTTACSECGKTGNKPRSSTVGQGRDIPLFCAACWAKS